MPAPAAGWNALAHIGPFQTEFQVIWCTFRSATTLARGFAEAREITVSFQSFAAKEQQKSFVPTG
jgi:hypothetical protein